MWVWVSTENQTLRQSKVVQQISNTITSIRIQYKLGMVVYTCNPSLGETEAGRSWIWGMLGQYHEFKARLGYIARHCIQYTHARTHARAHAHACTHVHTHAHTRTHAHTHTHTRTRNERSNYSPFMMLWYGVMYVMGNWFPGLNANLQFTNNESRGLRRRK
jgi:hypothetical protein